MFWLWIMATFVAFFVKGLCGFANTLVFTSILGFGANNVNISPVELILGYPSNIILVWNNRKQLKPKVFIPLSALILVGSVPGALLLKNVNAQYIKIVFGVIVVLVGIEMLLRESGILKVKESKILLGFIGLLSGVMCGLFGVGILMAAYITKISKSSNELKANLCAVFIVENTFRIILYSILGVITLESLKLTLYLIPVMLLALFGGILCSKFINEKIVKRIVIVLLIISGIALVIKSI